MDQGSGFQPHDADRPGSNPARPAEPTHKLTATTNTQPITQPTDHEPIDAVQAALNTIRQATTTLTQTTLWSRPDALARQAVHDGFQTLQSLHAAWLTLVHDLDTRPNAVPGARAGYTARTYLRSTLHRTAEQAASDVRAAHTLTNTDPTTGGLPELAHAFATGHISREHVDTAVRTLRKIPKDILTQPVPKEPDTTDSPHTDKDNDEPPDDNPHEHDTHDQTNETPNTPPPTDHIPAGHAIDTFFTTHSQQLDPRQTNHIAKHLLTTLNPNDHDGFNPTAHEKRGLTHTTDSTGMLIGRFQLDPADSATVTTAIEHFSAPQPTHTETTPDGTTTTIRETRSTPQRRADALTHICRLALNTEHTGTTRDNQPPRIIIHTNVTDLHNTLHPTHTPNPDPTPTPQIHTPPTPQPAPTEAPPQAPTCDQLGPISPRLLARFACDAILQRVLLAPNGAILNLGRDTRTVTPTQRRALNARDKGCVIPGCAAKPQACEAHHVTWWRNNGKTDIDNLALLCPRDHTLIHLGIWDLTMVHGLPWATPPTWIDPQRQPLRNTLHHATNNAHQLGTQLHLHLNPPDPQPPWLHPPAPDHPTSNAEATFQTPDPPEQNKPPRSEPPPPGPPRSASAQPQPPPSQPP